METLEIEPRVLEPFTIEVTDLPGQRVARLPRVPPDVTIGEVIGPVSERFRMPRTSGNGEPLTIYARLERTGEQLLNSDRVGAVLQPNDRLVLRHNVDAGRGR